MKYIERGLKEIKEQKFSAARASIRILSMGKKQSKNSPSYAALAYLYNEARKYGWYDELYDSYNASYNGVDDPKKYDPALVTAGSKNWGNLVYENASLALKYDDKNQLAHAMMVMGYLFKNDTANARKEMETAISLSPNDSYTLDIQGKYYWALRQYDKSIASYQAALKGANLYERVYYGLAIAYLADKKYEDALAALQKYIGNTSLTGLSYYQVREVGGFYEYAATADTAKTFFYVDEGLSVIANSDRDRQYDFSSLIQLLYNIYSQSTLDLINACIQKDDEKINKAIDNGADVNAIYAFYKQKISKMSPLLYAAQNHNASLIFKLLKAGANPKSKGQYGNTALHLLGGYKEDNISVLPMAEALIAAGADVNSKNDDGQTPLISSCLYKDFDYLKFLVHAGADVNAKDNKGKTAAVSVYNGADNSASMLNFLILSGNKLDTEDINNIYETAFYYCPNSMSVLYVMLKNKMPYDFQKSSNEYAIYYKDLYDYIRKEAVSTNKGVLFDKLLQADVKGFILAVKANKDTAMYNKTGIAVTNFTYGKSFFNVLVHYGADTVYNMYSKAEGRNTSGFEVFYPKKIKKKFDDLFGKYRLYMEELDEIDADIQYDLNHPGEAAIKTKGDLCEASITAGKRLIRMLEIYKKINAEDYSRSDKLSPDSKKLVLDQIAFFRKELSNSAASHIETFKCSNPFPREN